MQRNRARTNSLLLFHQLMPAVPNWSTARGVPAVAAAALLRAHVAVGVPVVVLEPFWQGNLLQCTPYLTHVSQCYVTAAD
jgi:hypothetical protein